MKIIVGSLMLFTFGIVAPAQEPKVVTVSPQVTKVITGYARKAKLYAELSAISERIVKNSPFSAEAVSGSVQTLADGNRIVHSSTSKLYRNSEGRFRREMNNGSGGILGTYYSYSPGVTILDPVIGSKYLLDEKLKTAEQQLFRITTERSLLGGDAAKIAEERTAEAKHLLDAAKIGAEIKAVPSTAPVAIFRSRDGQTLTGGLTGSAVSVFRGAEGQPFGSTMTWPTTASGGTGWAKYESKTEKLGTQNIEGVDAEGMRTTTTIPAGAIGNERPIEMVYERWFSKDLQLVVMSKNSDPRSGEQTYRLTGIVRTEPDPSLFALPAGYRVIGQPAKALKVGVAGQEIEKFAVEKAAQTGVTVGKAKP